MKQVTAINSAPPLPNWQAAAAALRDGGGPYAALYALLGVDSVAMGETAAEQAAIEGLAAQRSPATSIYDRRYTAHIYPEPGVAEGQVYEALRDYAAQHATPDPAMVEIRNREILKLLDTWKAEGPPSPEDVEFWRQFDADMARARRGGGSPAPAAGEWVPTYQDWVQERDNARARANEAGELRQKLAVAEKRIADLEAALAVPEEPR